MSRTPRILAGIDLTAFVNVCEGAPRRRAGTSAAPTSAPASREFSPHRRRRNADTRSPTRAIPAIGALSSPTPFSTVEGTVVQRCFRPGGGPCFGGVGWLLKLFTKNVLETALNEELTEHLGHEKSRAGQGRVRWTMRWKPALNAFAITFAVRRPTAETYSTRTAGNTITETGPIVALGNRPAMGRRVRIAGRTRRRWRPHPAIRCRRRASGRGPVFRSSRWWKGCASVWRRMPGGSLAARCGRRRR